MDEQELVKFAKQGDLDAFNRLVITYQGLAYNVAYRLLSNPASAEDITQDAFISAYKKIHSFRGGSFKAWLLRIVTNASYDELRRLKRRPTTPLEPFDQDNEEIESPTWLADPNETPEEHAIREDLNKVLQACLEGLETDFRSVIILVDIQGMNYAEAAQVTQNPLGTIKSRLARARSKMQDCLHNFGELLPDKFRLEGERT